MSFVTPCASTGTGKKLMRLVGCCKDGIADVLLPFVPTPTAIKQHPLHNHILSFTTGDECDITDSIPIPPDSRATQRQRTAAASSSHNSETSRVYSTAPWLDSSKENAYKGMALRALADRGLTSGFDMGRLRGSQFYCTTNRLTGRKCCYGDRHDSNNFFVNLERSGRMTYTCHSSRCSDKKELGLGEWCDGLDSMLANTDMWQPGNRIDATLLRTACDYARRSTPKKEKQVDQDWYPQYEQTVCNYLSNFLVFITEPAIYVLQTRDADGNVLTHNRYDSKRLSNVVKPYDAAFQMWDRSHLRDSMATKARFVGQPWDSRVAPDEYNLCAGMMPLLTAERKQLTADELEQLQPILTHIKEVLCAGNEQDYQHLMAWIAHVAQDPAEKVGWCPVIISDQGTGKGVSLHLHTFFSQAVLLFALVASMTCLVEDGAWFKAWFVQGPYLLSTDVVSYVGPLQTMLFCCR